MTKEFAYEVWEKGEELDNWACDRNEQGEIESNGGVEHLIAYQGKYYLIITDFNDQVIYRKGYSEVKPSELEQGDFILDLIRKYEGKRKPKSPNIKVIDEESGHIVA